LAHLTLTFAATRAATVFLHIFALLICSELSYVSYLVAAMFLSPDMLTTKEGSLRRGIIDVIVMSFFVGGTTSLLF